MDENMTAPKGTPDEAALRERAANAMMDKERARYEAIAATAPKPKKPYTATTVNTLINQFNDTIDALGGADLPNVEIDLKGAERWPEALPAAIFVPLVALFQAVEQVAGGKFAGKYTMSPDELTDDTGLRMAAGQLRRMASDAMLAKAMQAPVGGAAMGEEEGEEEGEEDEATDEKPKAPAPMTRGTMSDEDKALMDNMG